MTRHRYKRLFFFYVTRWSGIDSAVLFTPLWAVFNLIPVSRPFLSPAKGPVTARADLLREVEFFMCHLWLSVILLIRLLEARDWGETIHPSLFKLSLMIYERWVNADQGCVLATLCRKEDDQINLRQSQCTSYRPTLMPRHFRSRPSCHFYFSSPSALLS